MLSSGDVLVMFDLLCHLQDSNKIEDPEIAKGTDGYVLHASNHSRCFSSLPKGGRCGAIRFEVHHDSPEANLLDTSHASYSVGHVNDRRPLKPVW